MQQQPRSASTMHSLHLPGLQRAMHAADAALTSFAVSLSSVPREGDESRMQRVDSSRSLASTASPAPSTTSVSPEALTSDCTSRISELSPPVPLLALKIGGAAAAQTPEAARSPNEPMLSASPCRVVEKETDSSLPPSASASDSVAASNLDTLARVSAMFLEIEKQNVQELREAKEAAVESAGKEESVVGAEGVHEKGLQKLTISKHEWQQHLQLTTMPQQSSWQQQSSRASASHSHSHSFSQPSSPLPRRSLHRSSSSESSHPVLGSKLPLTAARFNNSSYLSAEAFEEYFRHARSLTEVVQRISNDHPTYATVSIYSRARRNGLKYDSEGRACKRGVPM